MASVNGKAITTGSTLQQGETDTPWSLFIDSRFNVQNTFLQIAKITSRNKPQAVQTKCFQTSRVIGKVSPPARRFERNNL